MSDPLVDPTELGIYLNDPAINVERADDVITDAQTLCETVINPLPAGAYVVVKRVAARAYVSITSARQVQLGNAPPPFGAAAGGLGGVWLSRSDKADLRRLAGGGGAFSIETMPATAGQNLPWWELGGADSLTGFDLP